MRKEEEYFALLSKISQKLNSSLDPNEVLSSAMLMVIELMNAERGFIALLEDGKLTFPVAKNLDSKTMESGSEISKTLINKVVNEGIPVVTMDARIDDRFSNLSSVIAFGLRSVLCVPLNIKERVIGAIYVDNRAKTGVFTPKDKELLLSFANHAAIAIENARLYDSLRRSIDEKLTLQKQIHDEEKKSAVLKETNQIRQELVEYLVHDLRNPLMAISAGLTMVTAKDGVISEKDPEILQSAMSCAQEMEYMVTAILDVYKMEAGLMSYDKKIIPLNEIVEKVIESHRNLKDNLLLNKSIPPQIRLLADPKLTYRILMNLVGNAVKFTKQGIIQVKAQKAEEPGMILISVADTGPGIPDEYHEVVFDRFKSVEIRKTTNNKYSTGLGLAFCKLAVELMGGKIWLKSKVNFGTTIYFTLPSADE